MAALSMWSPLALLAAILGYTVIAVVLMVAPMLLPLLREARRARRAGEEPTFVLLRPYPTYLLRFRRVFIALLVVPPVLLVAAWFVARMR